MKKIAFAMALLAAMGVAEARSYNQGGFYLGGGIAPKNIDRFKGPLFMQSFIAKGRMQPLLEDMVVKIIINDRTALFGPALYLEAVNK